MLHDNALNVVRPMRDTSLPSFWCFAHSLQLTIEDGVLAQQAVIDILAVCIEGLLDTSYIQH